MASLKGIPDSKSGFQIRYLGIHAEAWLMHAAVHCPPQDIDYEENTIHFNACIRHVPER